jgi:hypothetical protein
MDGGREGGREGGKVNELVTAVTGEDRITNSILQSCKTNVVQLEKYLLQFKYGVGGYSVCEHSVCMLSGTSIAVMSHCDIHHECVRRESIIFYVWKDDIILDLDVTPFIVTNRSYSMGFNSVTNRS